jgi:hypothetical protein
MPRIRSIKPGFFTNDALAEVHPLGRLLFSGLWCHADRAGRLEDRPRKLKAEVLPYDDCDIDALLNDLAARGFVVRYQAGGVRYLQVVNFDKHQTPNIKEIDSTIPAPASTVPAPYEHSTGDIPESHLTDLGTVTDQEQEQAWEGVQGEPPAAAPPPPRQIHPVPRPEKAKREPPKTKLPPDFSLTDERREWLAENRPDLDPEYAHEEFCTYWRGEGGVKANWQATWQNSMLKARAPARASPNGYHRQLTREQRNIDALNRGIPS